MIASFSYPWFAITKNLVEGLKRVPAQMAKLIESGRHREPGMNPASYSFDVLVSRRMIP